MMRSIIVQMALMNKRFQTGEPLVQKSRRVDFRLLVMLVFFKNPMTRDDLVRLSGEKRTPIYEALIRLERDGYVERFAKREGKGRPRIYWQMAN